MGPWGRRVGDMVGTWRRPHLGKMWALDPPVPVSQRTCWKLSLALPAQKRRCAEDCPRPSRHQIKHGRDSLRSSDVIQDMLETSPPPPPGGSTDIGAEGCSRLPDYLKTKCYAGNCPRTSRHQREHLYLYLYLSLVIKQAEPNDR